MNGEFNRTVRDFAYCSRGDDRGLFGTPVLLERVVSGSESADGAHGRWIGLLNVGQRGLEQLRSTLAGLKQRSDFDSLDMPALLNALHADGARIEVSYVHGHWRGVNDLDDYLLAADFAQAQTP
jgi:phosphoenolpyruvate phosphomutase